MQYYGFVERSSCPFRDFMIASLCCTGIFHLDRVLRFGRVLRRGAARNRASRVILSSVVVRGLGKVVPIAGLSSTCG